MSKVILEFDTEKDSKVDINAATRARDLALCIWEMKKRVKSEWDKCEVGSDMEKLVDDINNIIENGIGDIWDYTE